MRRADPFLISVLTLLSMAPAHAAGPRRFDVPAGRLGAVLARFGTEAGLSVGLTDQELARRYTRGVDGTMSVEAALRDLLAGTGATYTMPDPATVRIVPAPPRRLFRRRETVKPDAQLPADLPAEEAEIVVTASKQETRLIDYPGAVSVVPFDFAGEALTPSAGTEALIARLPSLASTHLGPGRDKLFIRGVADSSFNGPTPATVAQYLGDVRLNYSAPDPDLNLYDMSGAEVLEGPKGTLYGGAAIGGIIRLIPNPPELGRFAGSFSTGVSDTAHGGIGLDSAAMLNLSIGRDFALRTVGYATRDVGYIDDLQRGLKDVNRTNSYGGRIDLRYAPSEDFTLDIGGVGQNIDTRDGQYAELGGPPLTRRSAIAQPFDNDYRLGYATINARLFGLDLVSATGCTHHELDSVFDATRGGPQPRAFVENVDIDLFTHETRLTGGDPRAFNYLVGASVLHDRTRLTRQIGPLDTLQPLRGVINDNLEAALFGQTSIPLLSDLTLSLGGRLNYSESTGQVLTVRVPPRDAPRRREFRVLPMAALAWRPTARLLIFGRYQEGFRPGGLSITAPRTAERFEPDRITTFEAGLRLGDPALDRFSAGLTLSHARWDRIQADLVNNNGLPFTANIGSGRISGLEAQADWRPTSSLAFEAALFLNDSALDRPAPGLTALRERNLPNIAETGARGSLRYTRAVGGGLSLDATASVRYVGPSMLGIGPPLDLLEGDYLDTAIGARIGTERIGASFGITNIADARANRFSFGDPFGIVNRNEVTPLRPRTIRIGIDGHF